MTAPPLVTTSDTDLASWQAGSQSFFLEAACAEVRKYCGWHIAPQVAVTSQRTWIGAGGLVTLPSSYVTAINLITLGGDTTLTPLVADTDYTWDSPKAWLRLHPQSLSVPWPGYQEPYVSVGYVHGYTDAPSDVKAVIFEVMATAMELPASNAAKVQTMQYTFEMNPDIGISLSKTQRERLGSYKIPKFGGLVRP